MFTHFEKENCEVLNCNLHHRLLTRKMHPNFKKLCLSVEWTEMCFTRQVIGGLIWYTPVLCGYSILQYSSIYYLASALLCFGTRPVILNTKHQHW